LIKWKGGISMFQRVNFSDFRQAFFNQGRGNQFSYEALQALFNHLEEVEGETGEEMELDVIALCCDYVEYKDFQEFKEDYPSIDSMDQLRDETTVIEFKDGFLIHAF